MFPPDDTQYQRGLAALLRAERHIEHAVLDTLDDWLETTRYVILREVGQAFGLTAAGYTDPSPAVDAATLAYETWRRSLNNRLVPQVGIAFGEAYRQIRHGHAPQRYEVAYLETVSDRLRAWPEGAFEQIRTALVEAVTDGEDYDQIRDRVGSILGIDSRTRDLRARIGEIEALLTDDDPDLDPATRKELAAERRALWREHDDSLGEWRWKARRIARTEAHAATEAAKIKAAQDAAYESGQTVFKRWRSTRDLRVRASHRVADGQVVCLADPFRVGAALLQFPGDPAALAPQEVINCRCVSAIWSADMLQDGLQGPDGSIGEVKPGGVRLGPDDPDAMEKAIDEAADELGQPRPQHPRPANRPRADLPTPIELTDERAEALPDLSEVSDDDLVDLLEQAHDARDDDLYEWADAEWERRQAAREAEDDFGDRVHDDLDGGIPPPSDPPDESPGGGDDDDGRVLGGPTAVDAAELAEYLNLVMPGDDLSEDEHAAVLRWQSMDRFYQRVQEVTRGNADDPEAEEVAESLSELIERQEVGRPIVAWRGERNSPAAFGVPAEELSGLIGQSIKAGGERFYELQGRRLRTRIRFVTSGFFVSEGVLVVGRRVLGLTNSSPANCRATHLAVAASEQSTRHNGADRCTTGGSGPHVRV